MQFYADSPADYRAKLKAIEVLGGIVVYAEVAFGGYVEWRDDKSLPLLIQRAHPVVSVGRKWITVERPNGDTAALCLSPTTGLSSLYDGGLIKIVAVFNRT